ncbi:hypothetical protein FRC00_005760 [Tulasnella sp. 408]|nr:hypothetical protein FRC00_005760 [Tulasnella sp. 408]
MYSQTRGGTRGGAAEFKWSDVGADKDREHYLGKFAYDFGTITSLIMSNWLRWQKNKDVHWYNRDAKDGEEERAAEIRKIKEAEEDALAAALGFAPVKRVSTTEGPSSSSGPTKSPEEKEAEKEEKRRKKEEKRLRKEEKRERKERRRADREDRHQHDQGGSRPRSRSRDAGHRHRRSSSMSRSRSPPPRRENHRLYRTSPTRHPRDRSPRDKERDDGRRPSRRAYHSRSRSRSRSPPPRSRGRHDVDDRRPQDERQRGE